MSKKVIAAQEQYSLLPSRSIHKGITIYMVSHQTHIGHHELQHHVISGNFQTLQQTNLSMEVT